MFGFSLGGHIYDLVLSPSVLCLLFSFYLPQSPIKSPTSVPNTGSPMETKGVNIDFSDGDFGGSPPAVDTFREIAL